MCACEFEGESVCVKLGVSMCQDGCVCVCVCVCVSVCVCAQSSNLSSLFISLT